MHKTFVYSTLLAFVIGSTAMTTTAKSDELAQTVRLCEANPSCAHQPPDMTGVRLFKLRTNGMTISVRCAPDGSCWRMYPKRGAVPVTNMTNLLAAK